MSRTIILLVCLTFAAGCRKHSGVDNGPLGPGSVASIRYYDANLKATRSTWFDFQGTQLIRIRQQVVDSEYGWSPVLAVDNSAYNFQYHDTSQEPVSYSSTDTTYWPDSSVTTVPEQHFLLGYDSLGRIVSDTLLDTTIPYANRSYRWYYYSTGIGVYSVVYFDSAYLPLQKYDSIYYADQVDWCAGNWSVYSFGATRNPLYDAALGNSIGPLMFYIGTGAIVTPPCLPIDFFSQYLPVAGQGGWTGPFSFTWNTDGSGMVTGGMEVPPSSSYGTTIVTFTYK